MIFSNLRATMNFEINNREFQRDLLNYSTDINSMIDYIIMPLEIKKEWSDVYITTNNVMIPHRNIVDEWRNKIIQHFDSIKKENGSEQSAKRQ